MPKILLNCADELNTVKITAEKARKGICLDGPCEGETVYFEGDSFSVVLTSALSFMGRARRAMERGDEQRLLERAAALIDRPDGEKALTREGEKLQIIPHDFEVPPECACSGPAGHVRYGPFCRA